MIEFPTKVALLAAGVFHGDLYWGSNLSCLICARR
jgi:hypothetical protein